MDNKLKKLRSKKDISQVALAEKLDVSQKTVSSWEVGRTTPKPRQMQLMEDLFQVPKEEIFFTAFNYKNELKEKEVSK
ncbi:helix-turn-helix domain-containing protein [Enterococcus italicus]|uniref:helix-turn-helix transcriptional regulator n=1 Tax=Enterococcus italicus TaxID=246144 RepID=UPI0020732F94|nr:helix-turn-helix transcriptional regulator [Enterococcus italicus]MCM6931269.1 helix-turn-helix domain-containing protein [Enterococcus italicus]